MSNGERRFEFTVPYDVISQVCRTTPLTVETAWVAATDFFRGHVRAEYQIPVGVPVFSEFRWAKPEKADEMSDLIVVVIVPAQEQANA